MIHSQRPERLANALDLLIMLAPNKAWIGAITLVAALAASVLSYSLPPVYTASVQLMPVNQKRATSIELLAQLGDRQTGAWSDRPYPDSLPLAVLRSRQMADTLIERFFLDRVYGVASPKRARAKLASNTSITVNALGMLVIEVAAQDKALVAPLANGYADALLAVMTTLNAHHAEQHARFLQQQLALVKTSLVQAEMRYHAQGATINAIDDSAGQLAGARALRQQIAQQEVVLGAMSARLTAAHPDYLRAIAELESARRTLLLGNDGIGGGGPGGVGAAGAGLGTIHSKRELDRMQRLHDALSQQFQLALVRQGRVAPGLRILERAIAPEHHSAPRPPLIILSSTLAALFCSTAWILLTSQQRYMVSAGLRPFKQPTAHAAIA